MEIEMMNLCSRCKANPAVIYITKMEGDKTTNEGLCLKCAKELGIAPLNQMMDQLGINDADIDTLNSEMSDFMSNMADPSAMAEMLGTDGDEGGAPTAPLNFLQNFMNSHGGPNNDA